MPAEPGMHVSRLGYLRQSARPLQRHFHYQFPIAEQSHCSQSTMLPLIRHGARGSPKLLRSRCHTSYNTRYALRISALTSASISFSRNVTAAAGQADSFAVSNVPYSQQLRHLSTIEEWVNVCEERGFEFQGVDNFAAIRKLVEVLPFTSTELIVHLCLK